MKFILFYTDRFDLSRGVSWCHNRCQCLSLDQWLQTERVNLGNGEIKRRSRTTGLSYHAIGRCNPSRRGMPRIGFGIGAQSEPRSYTRSPDRAHQVPSFGVTPPEGPTPKTSHPTRTTLLGESYPKKIASQEVYSSPGLCPALLVQTSTVFGDFKRRSAKSEHLHPQPCLRPTAFSISSDPEFVIRLQGANA